MRKLSLPDARRRLPLPPTSKWPSGVFDVEIFKTGALSISLFAPQGTDHQTPHAQDEVYVFVSGSGILASGTTELEFETGDAIYVPAGEAHAFKPPLDFTAWVVFVAPVNGA